jgi:uncharacterized protein YdhG (YjbR/CyaY superfamily)
MQSKAATVAHYLAELPEDRRKTLNAVRELIRANIDPGFSEGMGYGMMGWSVPHSRYPAGYHCNPKEPLPFAGLASQKNHMSLYLCLPSMGEPNAEADAEADWFRAAWAKTGKKLDMGKGCIRFKKVEDLALEVIAELFRRMSVDKFVAQYEAARAAYKPKSRVEIQTMMAERKAAKAVVSKRPSTSSGRTESEAAKKATEKRVASGNAGVSQRPSTGSGRTVSGAAEKAPVNTATVKKAVVSKRPSTGSGRTVSGAAEKAPVNKATAKKAGVSKRPSTGSGRTVSGAVRKAVTKKTVRGKR